MASLASRREPVVYSGPITANVTFYSHEAAVLFAELFPESSGQLANDRDITYYFNTDEIHDDPEDEEFSPYSFTVTFLTPKEEILGSIDVAISGSESNGKSFVLEMIKTDYTEKKGIRKYKGLGARFLTAFETIAKMSGIKKVKLLALEHVKNFYPKYGYTKNENPTLRKGYPMSKMVAGKSSKRSRAVSKKRRTTRRL
jgi:hypothetical protein